jgi:ABC-2 type transport system ATP-binding protein
MSISHASNQAAEAPALLARAVRKTFRRDHETIVALDDVSLTARAGSLTALVGPDGAGKTTFIRLLAGLLPLDGGSLKVMGMDVGADPQAVQTSVAYMPQRFGLYEDLTVMENLDLYADLHGVEAATRREQYPRLMEMTALGPFTNRLAGNLSGGMKQKLGLACALVEAPELILLDEPTAGVDPLSRYELWQIIHRLVREEHVSVLLATSYLDEAERSDHAVILHKGRILAEGPPQDIAAAAKDRVGLLDPKSGEPARNLQARMFGYSAIADAVPQAGRVRVVYAAPSAFAEACKGEGAPEPAKPRFEDGFMVLLRGVEHAQPEAALTLAQPLNARHGESVIEVRDLVRRFGSFTAVNHIGFDVKRGEVFGLLGPNGAGKTTTFRMLCGLLPASGGMLRVAGADLRRTGAAARRNIGYVAQKFSLYGQLSVIENLEFFSSAYGLRGTRKRGRIDWALRQFELGPLKDTASALLPGGFKQRLAMAAALLHEPAILFLDEPTSGADPLARREFWRRISALAEQGVTVIVTTHFMEEAEYCDHVAILDAGSILVRGTPAEIRRHAEPQGGREATMEDAFVAIVEEARGARPAS